MKTRKSLSWILFLSGVMLSSPSLAETETVPIPTHRLSYENLTVVRHNPEGLQDDFKLSYRYRLYGENPGLLFRECEILTGTTTYLTPAFIRTGGRVAVRPLAILYLESRLEWVGSFGTLGHIMGFPDALSDSSDAAREEREGEELQTTGRLTTLIAQVRAKAGPVVVRSTGSMIHSKMDLTGGDRVWYDGVNDVLMPADGWMLHLDTDLLWMDGGPWIAGIRHTMDHVFYPDADTFDDNLLKEKTPTHRLGPLVAYTFFNEPGAAFNRPTLALILNWHLKHPYRAGQEIHQAMPYALIAFAFRGDLLQSEP